MSKDPSTGASQVHEHAFTLTVNGRRVPGVYWCAHRDDPRAPLVLVSHGGSGHKRAPSVMDVVSGLTAGHGFVVVSIDGPVHGDRREPFAEGPAVRDEFRERWARGGSVEPMVEDWSAALEHVLGCLGTPERAVGWMGLSMGTAYGLPFVAAQPRRFSAAVLGMWGLCRPGSERLAQDAAAVSCPVAFHQKWDDAVFTREGQIRLYEALGSAEKKLCIYPGGHTDPKGEQLHDALDFLRRKLTPAAA